MAFCAVNVIDRKERENESCRRGRGYEYFVLSSGVLYCVVLYYGYEEGGGDENSIREEDRDKKEDEDRDEKGDRGEG